MIILLISYGVGGSEALNPLYIRLKDIEGLEVSNIAITDLSMDKLTDGIRIKEEYIFNYIEGMEPDLVINERSNGLEIQNRITKFCKEKNIMNISVLDFYGGYRRRFTDIPDLIIIPSKSIYEEMIEEGFGSKRLVVCGTPAFDRLEKYRNIKSERQNILFMSQPLHGLERDLFRQIYNKVRNYGNRKIYIKVHPNEDISKWNGLTKDFEEVEVIKISNKEDFLKYSVGYELVIGYNSTVMLQTTMLGVTTITLEFDSIELVDKFLKGEKIETRNKYIDFEKNATDKCLKIILENINEIREKRE